MTPETDDPTSRGGVPTPATTVSARWSRLPGAAAGLAYAAISTSLIAITIATPQQVSLIALMVLCGIGILACALAAAWCARKGTARYLRSLAVKRTPPACTADSPCNVCRGVNQWGGTSSAGSTATSSGARWV